MESIKKQFIEVIKYSQSGIENPLVDNLFDQWYNAKQFFINCWQGYTYEVGKVSFELDPESKVINYMGFLSHLDRRYNENELLTFLSTQGAEAFYNNAVRENYVLKNGVIIPAGSKIIKAFKFFVANDTTLRAIQDEASMELQKDRVEGTLVLSVHPLDFLSSSENTYNWRSCHSLDGEYRAGNLSYMVDSCTFMRYLKGDKEEKLPNFPETVPWNSKKWRMLMFTNNTNSLLFAGRQYPFASKASLNIVKEAFLTSIRQGNLIKHWSSWHNDFAKPQISHEDGEDCGGHVIDYTYYFINNGIYDKRHIIKDVKGSHHFNDLLRSSLYEPYYSWLKVPYEEDYKIKIGGQVKCLRCGENPICVSDSMMCVDCELKYGTSEDDTFCYCEMCGRRVLTDETRWVMDIGNVCAYCVDEYCTECDACGECIAIDDAYSDRDGNGHYCSYCIDDLDY